MIVHRCDVCGFETEDASQLARLDGKLALHQVAMDPQASAAAAAVDVCSSPHCRLRGIHQVAEALVLLAQEKSGLAPPDLVAKPAGG